jgi:hypothetical protein
MKRRYVLPMLGWLAIATLATILEGAPTRLPGLALGSVALLHALRIAALFAIGVVIATVLVRASAGSLPTQLSTTGLSYEAEETSETLAALAELQLQVDRHDALMERIAIQLDTVRRTI